ncbi:unnamed protein product [Clonostachys rosea]|uniref:Zn(2)-C6 fungal-type domain-containing protein n=1 Tax=Bionectria ochroleuca TaxID=29856 RepID=A0ABY6UYH0_BIOOC|nr:unnamed protein product [Clonostachys rosea]
MEELQYTKRTRQACEPCRRKKSRCPGEKPECSYCQRLGQQCVYKAVSSGSGSDPTDAQVRHNRKLVRIDVLNNEHRLGNLEGQMSRLIQQLSNTRTHLKGLTHLFFIILKPREFESSPSLSSFRSTTIASNQSSVRCGSRQRNRASSKFCLKSNLFNSKSSAIFTDGEIIDMGRIYLTWCHGQTISLFDEASFLSSLKFRDPELLCAIGALTERFPPRLLTDQSKELIESLSQRSRKAVMDKIAEGEVQLSTLQTLCVLSICNFTSGKVTQAGLNIAMADHIKDTTDWVETDSHDDERDRCFRSISVLKKLQSSVLPSINKILPSTSYPVGHSNSQSNVQRDGGIPFYAEKLCDVWQMARAYAASQPIANDPPPWDSRSEFSEVMSRHLELDCLIPVKYRFRLNNMAEYDSETLLQNRGYWASFIFIQFVYSAIPCLLNHPFLLSLRLRHFRHTIPESFIQQSYEQLTRFMGWIIYFIDLLERKSFQVSDPVLAHCVVIVATIHLQHSFVKDTALQQKASRGFDKCLRFLRRMGQMWPCVALMVENLKTLQGSVVSLPSEEAGQERTNASGEPSFSINARLLWDVLIYDRAGQVNARADYSMLGSTLVSREPEKGAEAPVVDAKFDLIGSAGLTGHKAMIHQGPAYPPEDENTNDFDEDNIDTTPHAITNMAITIGDVNLEGVGGYGNEESMFLQAHDYGRAIGDWFDFDAI